MPRAQLTEIVWRVSSRSNGTECVEVARSEAKILVRDTKNRDMPTLSFSSRAWENFLRIIQAG
jgi:hypothetical protein